MYLNGFQNYNITKKICAKFCYDLYDAEDTKSGERVFLKVLDDRFSRDQSNVRHFFRSARIAEMLNMSEVVSAYHHDGVESTYFIVGEPVIYKSLGLFVHEQFPIQFDTVMEIISKIAEVLRRTHIHGVIHGMLNPNSIYIGGNNKIKIEDFGFVWMARHMIKKGEIENRGFSYYLAPEICFGIEAVDGRADIYSMGVLLHRFLTDGIGFNESLHPEPKRKSLIDSIPNIRRVVPKQAPALEEILNKCLQINPGKRYQNLTDFLGALKNIPRVHSAPKRRKKKNRHPLKWL